MAKPIAVLFDIDETLVHTGGAGARSWAWAFDQLHGVPADIGKHPRELPRSASPAVTTASTSCALRGPTTCCSL